MRRLIEKYTPDNNSDMSFYETMKQDYYDDDDDDDLYREDDFHDTGSCSRHLSTQRRQANLYANA